MRQTTRKGPLFLASPKIKNSLSLAIRGVGVGLLDHRVSLGAKHDSVVGAGAIPSDANEHRRLPRHANEKSELRAEGTHDETPEREGKGTTRVGEKKRTFCVSNDRRQESKFWA